MMKKNRNVIFENNKVIKTFENPESLEKEVNSLKDLSFLNGCLLSDGWRIVIPEVLDVDWEGGNYTMSFVKGKTIDELLNSKREVPWAQLGEALGHFHDHKKTNENLVKCFGDFNRSNSIIDLNEKILALFDPGYLYGKEVSRWQDIILFEWTVWLGQIKHSQSLIKELKVFEQGYKKVVELPKRNLFSELTTGWIKKGIIQAAKKKKSLRDKILYYLWSILFLCFTFVKFLPFSINNKWS